MRSVWLFFHQGVGRIRFFDFKLKGKVVQTTFRQISTLHQTTISYIFTGQNLPLLDTLNLSNFLSEHLEGPRSSPFYKYGTEIPEEAWFPHWPCHLFCLLSSLCPKMWCNPSPPWKDGLPACCMRERGCRWKRESKDTDLSVGELLKRRVCLCGRPTDSPPQQSCLESIS